MKQFFIISFTFLLFNSAFAQNYNHRYSLSDYTFIYDKDNLENIIVTPDDFVYAVHNVTHTPSGDEGFLVTSTDPSGMITFQHFYTFPNEVFKAYAMKQTDNGFMIAGQHADGNNNKRSFALEIEPSGTILWSMKYQPDPSSYIGENVDIIINSDGTAFLLGNGTRTFSSGTISTFPSITKITPTGEVMWSYLYYNGNVSSHNYVANDMEYDASNDKIIVVGTALNGSKKIFAFSFDSNGSPVDPYTTYTIGGQNVEQYTPNIITENGAGDKVIINFSTYDGTSPLYTNLQQHASLLEISGSTLTPNWTKIYGISMDHCHSRSFIKTDNGYGLVMGCDNLSSSGVIVVGPYSWTQMLVYLNTDNEGYLITNNAQTYFDVTGNNAYFANIKEHPTNNSAVIISNDGGGDVLGLTHIDYAGNTDVCSMKFPASSLDLNVAEIQENLERKEYARDEPLDILLSNNGSYQIINCTIDPGTVVIIEEQEGLVVAPSDNNAQNISNPSSVAFQDISITPNPTTNGIFSINFSEYEENTFIEIFNLQGQRIHSSNQINLSNLEIDLSNENSGLHLIRISLNQKIITKKILITK
ncbi:MAG: T9SS type A sorting domain-containing protein [Saprospiraceae bacterium]